MLAITAAQMGELNTEADARLARAEARRLADYAPPLAATAGRVGLEAAAQLGVALAHRAGFGETRQIRLLLQTMTHCGSHVDTDPQFAWLHPLLDREAAAPALERARLLHWHLTWYLERAYGARGVHGMAAALQAQRVDLALCASVGHAYGERALPFLARLHPQRMPFLSRQAAEALAEDAAVDAPRLGLGGAAAAPVLLMLRFGFGHRVADDPLHPWVAEVLATPGLGAEARTAALLERAQATLARWLAPVMEARR